MPYVYESGIISAPRQQVWEHIRNFNALPKWHPAIATSQLEGSTGVGVVRHFFLVGGGELREKLLGLSDQECSCSYTIIESPMPLTNYLATLKLYPITTTQETFMEWYAYFDATDLASAAETVQTVHNVFASGIESLRKFYSA